MKKSFLRLALFVNTAIVSSLAAGAWEVNEVFTNSDGTLQFVELYNPSNGGENIDTLLLTSTDSLANDQTFQFLGDTPSPTGGRTLLLATSIFQSQSGVVPDYIIPDDFLDFSGGSLDLFGVDTLTYGPLDIDGVLSTDGSGNSGQFATPTSYNGATGLPPQLTLASLNLQAGLQACLNDTGLTYTYEVFDLSCRNRSISDLTGIDQIQNLSSIDLGNNDGEGNWNSVSDISPLSVRAPLLRLDVGRNNVSDFSQLNFFGPQLAFFFADYNPATDYAPIYARTDLQGLGMSGNWGFDPSLLAGHVGLVEVRLADLGISDLSFLAGKTQLNSLDATSNRISDISVLTGLINLQYLNLGANRIIDITALQNLPLQGYLGLWGNRITSAAALSGQVGLDSIDISTNRLNDVTAFAGLTQLTYLGVSRNPLLSDISPLASLTSLTGLDLSDTGVSNLSAVVPMVGLQSLYLSNTVIDSASGQLTKVPASVNDLQVSPESRPTVGFLALSTVAVDLDAGPATVYVDFGFNPGTGGADANGVCINLIGPSGGNFGGCANPMDTSQIEILINPEAERGEWLLAIDVSDPNGNYLYNAGMLSLFGWDNLITFTGTGPGDSIRPELNTLMLSTTIVDVTAGAQIIDFAYNASDDSGSLGFIEVQLNTPNYSESLSRSFGPAPSTGVVRHLLAEVNSRGTWNITFQARDRGGNALWLNERELAIRRIPTSIDVQPSGSPAAGILIGDAPVSDLFLQSCLDGSGVTFLHELTSLNCDNYDSNNPGVVSLTGIGQFYNLQDVSFHGGSIIDASPLANLPLLASINLNQNQVSDVSWVGGLATQLRGLSIADNPVADLFPLNALVNLTAFNAQGLSIATSVLAGMPYLQQLSLGDSYVDADMANLTSLPLTSLDICGSPITSIDFLASFPNLNGLRICNSLVSDISVLSSLPVQYVTLHDNRIEDISALSGKALKGGLHLANNRISDISALAGLTQINDLYLYGNEIADISPLAGLTQLVYLDISNNLITDISALAGFTSLQTLELFGNGVFELTALSGMSALGFVNIDDNLVTAADVAEVAKIPVAATYAIASGDRPAITSFALDVVTVDMDSGDVRLNGSAVFGASPNGVLIDSFCIDFISPTSGSVYGGCSGGGASSADFSITLDSEVETGLWQARINACDANGQCYNYTGGLVNGFGAQGTLAVTGTDGGDSFAPALVDL